MNGFIRVLLTSLSLTAASSFSSAQIANNAAKPGDPAAVSGYDQINKPRSRVESGA